MKRSLVIADGEIISFINFFSKVMPLLLIKDLLSLFAISISNRFYGVIDVSTHIKWKSTPENEVGR